MFKCIKLTLMLLVLAGLVYFGHGFLLDKAGKYIYTKDELKPVDVIVVLSGESEERVVYGVKLFKEGWARKNRIIMTGGPVVGRHTVAGLMKELAEELGVPGKYVLLAEKSRSTEEDAKYTGEILKRYGFKSVILVTSPYHSRRAAVIFKKMLPGVRIISAPADKSWFSFDDWWKRTRDRDMVLSEYSKFVRLWIFGIQTDAPAGPVESQAGRGSE